MTTLTIRNVIAVTGGRHYDRPELVDAALSRLHSRCPIDLLVHGNCPTGADNFAANWCDFNCVPHTGRKYTAKWYVNGKLDKSAGPQRNRLMLETECPRILVAFPGGTGTGGCCKIARQLSIRVVDGETIGEEQIERLNVERFVIGV